MRCAEKLKQPHRWAVYIYEHEGGPSANSMRECRREHVFMRSPPRVARRDCDGTGHDENERLIRLDGQCVHCNCANFSSNQAQSSPPDTVCRTVPFAG